MATIAFCPRCVNYRVRPQAELFSAADMQSAGGLKARLQWEQQQDQIRLMEQQRAETDDKIPYEPLFHPWCAAASPYDATVIHAVEAAIDASEDDRPQLADAARRLALESRHTATALLDRARAGDYDAIVTLVGGGRVNVNPVAGDIEQTYVLCGRINQRGLCPLFERKES